MAKEKEKKVAVTNEDNVMDQIRENNLLGEKHVKAAIESIEKEEDEDKKKKAITMICIAKYNNLKALLNLRARRREEQATKSYLTKTKEVLDQTLSAKITPNEYEKKKKELQEENREAVNKSNKQYREEIEELRSSFLGKYEYYWD